MVRRCVFGGCSVQSGNGNIPVFSFPSDPKVAAKWDKEVAMTRKDWHIGRHNKSSMVCALHFCHCETNFANLAQWRDWQQRYLRLSKDAVPRGKVKDGVERLLSRTPQPNDDVAVDLCPPPAKKRRAEPQVLVPSVLHEVPSATIVLHPTSSTNSCTTTRTVSTQTRKLGISKGTQVPVALPSNPTKQCGTQTDSDCSHSVGVQVDEELWEDREKTDKMDADYKPPRSSRKAARSSNNCEGASYVFVSITKLLSLLSICRMCAQPATVTEENNIFCKGSVFAARVVCTVCKKGYTWRNQPFVRRLPILNLSISSAILFSGCSLAKVLRMFDLLQVRCISQSGVYRHWKKFVFPLCIDRWRQDQRALLLEARQLPQGMVVQGDGRSDSPGHCAKYGSYTFLESTLNKVVAFAVVQSNEVKGAVHCELEGLKRCLQQVGEKNVSTIVTDRHRQIAKYLREHVHVTHYYDIWHIAKSLGKKVDAAAKIRDCEVLGQWKKAIVYHLYWCATSTPAGNGDLVLAKWVSVFDHVHNIHEGLQDPLYPVCSHGPDLHERPWLQPATAASVKLEKIVDNTMLKNDVRKLSPMTQTAALESYHSLLLTWTLKTTAFSYIGMIARLSLAALHFNENSQRPQAKTADGKMRYSVLFPKVKKGGNSVRKIKEKCTYNYARCLMEDIIRRYRDNHRQLMEAINDIKVPPPLCDTFARPCKEDAIAAYVTRYNPR